MTRFIVDVTQLVHWQGRLTGIPRVVQELALRFPSVETSEVVYASWVKEVGAMCVVDLNATLAIRGDGIEYERQDNRVVDRPQVSAELSFRTAKTLVKKILRKTGAERLGVVVAARDKAYQNDMHNYRQINPGEGDLLFIGAGEWWDDNFITLVEQAHSRGTKIVQIAHDLLPIVTPQFAGHATDSLSQYNSRIMPIASLVLSVSQSTKHDLITWLTANNLIVPRIETFRLGEDFTAANPVRPTTTDFVKSGLVGGDFLLCVGTIEARKNHALLYYAYKLAASRGIKLPKLLIVGRRGYKTEDICYYIENDPAVNSDIILCNDIGDAELSWLYDNCLFTIYPSFYEGWGMPIAESIMRGAPCLASNTSSMIEVAPGYADYFTPSSTDELLNGIISLLEPGTLADRHATMANYVPTTWDDSFKQILKYMEKI